MSICGSSRSTFIIIVDISLCSQLISYLDSRRSRSHAQKKKMDSVDDLITCQICEYQFDEVRRVPKFFNCFHSFCLECAGKIHERSGMFECPNCREVTTGSNPKCLKTNFYTTRLMALVKDGGLDLGRKASSSGLSAAPRSSASASTSKWNSGGAQVQSDAGVDGQRRRFDRRTTGVGQANGFSDQLGATGIQRASTSNSSYSGFSTPLDRRTGRCEYGIFFVP